jgi:hypothetical protein
MSLPLNGSTWSVADFSNFTIGTFHPVLWEFENPTGDSTTSGKVSAAGFWTGFYKIVTDESVNIETTGKLGTDSFRVTFFSEKFFVASKNGGPYRLGIRKF